MYTLGPTPVADLKYKTGIAYIAIPTDLKREDYIRDCYENFRVSLWGEDGSFMNRVPISPEVLNFVEFPVDEKTKGSPVFYVTDELQSQPVIVGRIPIANQLGDNKEYQFKFKRVLGNSFVEIQGSPDTNSLSLTVDAADKSGKLFITVKGGDQDTALEIDVTGDIVVTSKNSVVFEQQEGFTVRTLDQDSEDDEETTFVQTVEGHAMKTEKFVINDGKENYVLGQKFKSFMSDFITEVGNSTVTTALGQMPLLNKIQIQAYIEKLDGLLSQIVFVDK